MARMFMYLVSRKMLDLGCPELCSLRLRLNRGEGLHNASQLACEAQQRLSIKMQQAERRRRLCISADCLILSIVTKDWRVLRVLVESIGVQLVGGAHLCDEM